MKLKTPISVVMIAYNEESNIQKVMKEYSQEILKKLPKGSEYLLYLDKPSDKTPQLARKVATKLGIKVIEGKKNLGYAEAMKVVLKKAKNEGVFFSDSSGKHQAQDFWKLLPYIEYYDIVTGDRQQRTDPFIRRVITQLQRLLVVTLFQVPFHDYNTGFKLLKKKVLDSTLTECKFTKQSFSTELLVRSYKKGFSIVSAPVIFRARKDESSGTNFKQLPSIIAANARGLFLLKLELIRKEELCQF
jgi:glycosyltransferase involved in cell wall biosynthesis